MKNKNITISLPEDLIIILKGMAGKRELSKFIAGIVRENIDQEKMNLEAAYKEAEKDQDRIETINDWSALDVEGWK